MVSYDFKKGDYNFMFCYFVFFRKILVFIENYVFSYVDLNFRSD